jgi:hypothetical protein
MDIDPLTGNLYKHRESGELVRAIKMSSDFKFTTRGGRDVYGESGDYIVKAVNGDHTWLIRNALFEAAYEQLPPTKYSRRSD